eukprot:g9354.t1
MPLCTPSDERAPATSLLPRGGRANVVGLKPVVVTGSDCKGPRSWVEIPSESVPTVNSGSSRGTDQQAASDRIRILSYNVLGARQGLSPKHGHVGLDIRNWSTRRDRLREEIWSYHESNSDGLHVVCLQEVTFRTLADTWVPFMTKLGLDRHVYQPKSDRPQRRHRSRCLGVAIFYSSNRFEKTSELRVVFSEEARGLRGNSDRERESLGCMSDSPEAVARAGTKVAPDDQFLRRVYGGDTGTGGPAGRANPATASRLEQDLEDKHDAAAMVRLRLKGSDDDQGGGGGANGNDKKERAITVVCAHLFYDPSRPDLKTAQCQMMFQALQRFHEKCAVAPVVGEPGGERSSLGVANLILCADFNSKPVADPSFMPGSLKAAAEARLPAAAAAAITAESPSLTKSKDIYPSDQAMASGVYSLLDFGCVPPEHPEHPDAFIPELLKAMEQEEKERAAMGGKGKWTFRRAGRSGDAPVAKAVHHPSGEWASGFGTALEDAYRDRGAVSPCFTTKTSSFSGVIDHIFVSTGEKNSGLAISGLLAFPRGAHLAEEMAPVSQETGMSGGDRRSRATQTPPTELRVCDVQDGRKPTDAPVGEVFPPIPNKLWGSDHLALGVEVTLL